MDWTQFIKRITINATAAEIYKAWSTQEGMESWFLRLAEFRNPGGELRKPDEPFQKADEYKWLWFGYSDDVAEQNRVLFANGIDQLQFIFSGGCIVTVTIKEESAETVCELKQEMTMDEEKEQRFFFIECGKGWTFYMTNLKSILEGGIDLRNKNASIKEVINA